MRRKMSKLARALLVQARLDPLSTVAPNPWGKTWCRAQHPFDKVGYICSRHEGHTGPHFAQTQEGFICEVEPNPWTNKRKSTKSSSG